MLALMALVGVALSSFVMMDTRQSEEADETTSGTKQSAEAPPETIAVDAILNDEESPETIPVDAIMHSADTSSVAMGDDPLVRFGGPSGALVLGANADDFLDGEGGNDVLRGADGNDTLHGGTGNDTLFGENGDDILRGHDDDDVLYGGGGDDALYAGAGDDALYGEDGDDQLHGYLNDDTLDGGAGTDVLFGGAGDDHLIGRGDATTDTLLGGSGADTLIAGTGDHLSGGAGTDTFHLTQDAIIDDFNPLDDRIEVTYEGDEPTLTTQLSDDGLILLADGAVVGTFAKVTTLDLDRISLVRA